MGDFGHFDLLPVVGGFGPPPTERQTTFDVAASTFAPHRFATKLPKDQTSLELTATERCAMIELTFAPDTAGHAGLVLQTGLGEAPTLSEVRIDQAQGHIEGVSRASHGGSPPGFGCWLVIQIDNPSLAEAYPFTPEQPLHHRAQLEHARPGVYLRFVGAGRFTLRIATSFISLDQARINL